jgi:photosystem II stability/assembly factor-like uncharacterized protein
MIEPTTGVTFAGVHKGSIYASENFGKSWQPRANGLTQRDVYCLSSIEVNGRTKLYAGTEPAHFFESADGGKTWEERPLLRSVPSVPTWTFPAAPHEAHVKNIAFDPREPKTIYAAIEVGGLLRSRDGGASWEEIPVPYADVHRIKIRPSDSNWIAISTGDGIYRSYDGGKNWDHLTLRTWRVGYPDALLIHPKREDLLFIAGAVNSPGTWRTTKDADSRIARSRDAGKSWEVLNAGLPEHIRGNFEAMTMEVWDGSCALFAGTTDGDIFFSDNEGDHWTKIAEGLPPISKGGHYRNLR